MTAAAGRPLRCAAVVAVALAAVAGCASSPRPDAATEPRPSTAKACPGAPRGTVTVHRLDSSATHRREQFVTYQPHGTTRSDPLRLLVLLHGASADETQWLDVGIASAADCLGGRGERNQTVIVLVDGSAVERDRGADPAPTERLVVDEILPAVRRLYPNAAGRRGTGIGGISLGGGWAFKIAAHHPELFSAVGGHSPALALSPDERRSLARHDVRAWTDVGTQDGLGTRVDDQSSLLRDAGVGVMAMHWDGRHDRQYWSEHTEDYLRFYAQTW